MENDPDHTPSMQQGQNAPQYSSSLSHSGHGQSLGHSVVPDLMKIYESLTQSKTPHTQQQGMGGNGEQNHQTSVHVPPQQQMYHNASHFYPPAPSAPTYPYMQPHSQQYNYAAHPSEMPAPQYSPPSDEYEDTKEVSSSGRTLRKRSVDKVEDDRSSSDGSSSRSRKKKKSDGRWSKRFTWPEDLHRDFVSAIFDVGLKHASPSALLEHMPEHNQITSERVKSHLQKYRLHRAKSKKEFMSCYEASLSNYQASGIKAKSLGSGEVAAHLAYSTMNEPEEVAPPASIPSHIDEVQDNAHEMIGTSRGGALILPKLTEEEKRSPLGASMGYMMGLFFALRQQLMANRAAAASAEGADASTVRHQVPFVSYPNSNEAAEQGDEGHCQDPNIPKWPPPPGHAFDVSQQIPSYQDQLNLAPVASIHQTPSSRTNLEESNLMKREMQNQMAFQNKMRALKQQELNKTKSTSNGAEQQGHAADGNAIGNPSAQSDDRSRIKQDDETFKDDAGNEDNDGEYQSTACESPVAGSGHGPGSAARATQRGLSMGATEEFWVNDEQLFEFLMNS